jgi:hypothetical protein
MHFPTRDLVVESQRELEVGGGVEGLGRVEKEWLVGGRGKEGLVVFRGAREREGRREESRTFMLLVVRNWSN